MRFDRMIRVGLTLKSMTQEQLSKKTGITQGGISRYVNGANKPNIDAMVKIAKVLDLDLNELKND